MFDLMYIPPPPKKNIYTKYLIIKFGSDCPMISFVMNKHVINTFKYIIIKFGSTSVRISVVICFRGEDPGEGEV